MLTKKTLVLFSYLRAEDFKTDLTVRSNPSDNLGNFGIKETQRLYPDLSQLTEISDLPNNATSTGKRGDGDTISGYDALNIDIGDVLPNMTEEEAKRLIGSFEMSFPQRYDEEADLKDERITNNEQPLSEEYSCESIKNSIIGYLKSVANHAFLLGCKIYLKVDEFLNYFSAKKSE